MTDVELPPDLLQLSFRWVHVLAGVAWLGFTFWLEWVWSSFEKTRPVERGVVLGLLGRTLFWLRWAALAAWLTGVSLLMVQYYAGPYFLDGGARPTVADWAPVFAGLLAAFVLYDPLFRFVGRRGWLEWVCGIAWAAAVIGFGRWLEGRGVSTRAIFVHLGALLGTLMVANVWMRIWPARRRMLAAVASGEASSGATEQRDRELAAARSRHNACMGIPLLMLMLGADQSGLTGAGGDWPWMVGGLFVIGACLCAMILAGLDSIGDGDA